MHFSNILLAMIVVVSGCSPRAAESPKAPFPSSYSLDNFQKLTLSIELEEISGLEWVGQDQLWAIEDESSIIYRLDPQTGKILQKRKFAKNKDIEDLLVVNDTAYVLQSNGTVYQVISPLAKDVESMEYPFQIKEKRDMEALIASQTEPSLYVFCKVCKADTGPDKASVFRFNLTTMSYDSEPFAVLKRQDIQPLLGDKPGKPLDIQPSAAAIHPIEKKLYIISSSGKWLLIADLNFKPEEVYRLAPGIFKQPEGITFDPKGNLYISNEAKDGEPNILVFAYNP